MSISDLEFGPGNSSLSNLYQRNGTEFVNLSRYEKGYRYEMKIQGLLENSKIEFSGNSRNFQEWQKNTNCGYDIKVRNPRDGSLLTVECKFALKTIYHSWFVRDWLSRSANIIVTNNPYSLSYKDRKILREHGKKLFSTMEFLFYIQKLARGNKYYLNSSVNSSEEYTNSEGYAGPVECNVPSRNSDKVESLSNKRQPFNKLMLFLGTRSLDIVRSFPFLGTWSLDLVNNGHRFI
jgi:hypothetical protein